MCPEGLSVSDTYCQPSASSSRPSGAASFLNVLNQHNLLESTMQNPYYDQITF